MFSPSTTMMEECGSELTRSWISMKRSSQRRMTLKSLSWLRLAQGWLFNRSRFSAILWVGRPFGKIKVSSLRTKCGLKDSVITCGKEMKKQQEKAGKNTWWMTRKTKMITWMRLSNEKIWKKQEDWQFSLKHSKTYGVCLDFVVRKIN